MMLILQIAVGIALAPLVLGLLGIGLTGVLTGIFGLLGRPLFLVMSLVAGFLVLLYSESGMLATIVMLFIGVVAAVFNGEEKPSEAKTVAETEKKV